MAIKRNKRKRWRRAAMRKAARDAALLGIQRKTRFPQRRTILQEARSPYHPPSWWPLEAQRMVEELRRTPLHLQEARLAELYAQRERRRKQAWNKRRAYGFAGESENEGRGYVPLETPYTLEAPEDIPPAIESGPSRLSPNIDPAAIDEIRQAALAAMSRAKANGAARIRAHAREWPWPSIIEKAKERIKRDPRFVPAKRRAEATQGAGVA